MWDVYIFMCLALPIDPPQVVYDHPTFKPALRRLCVDLELMDTRENHAGDVRQEFSCLRSRWSNFGLGPYLADGEWLPSADAAWSSYQFNRAYALHLREQIIQKPNHERELREAIEETDKLGEVYHAIHQYRCRFPVAYRREALNRIYHTVGSQNFSVQSLPPCVPVWRFREID